jgi:hypothetical protein
MHYNVICAFCEKEFNAKFRVPREIPNCEHSICTPCLEIHLRADEVLICPNNSHEFALNADLMIDFPVNKELVAQIDKREARGDNTAPKNVLVSSVADFPKIHKKEADNSKSVDSFVGITPFSEISKKISLLNSVGSKKVNTQVSDSLKIRESKMQELCLIHKKKLKAVCLEKLCKRKVCSSCGLYGNHKVGL